MKPVTNIAGSALAKVPGVSGWHRSKERIHVRLNNGGTVTLDSRQTPEAILAEAARLEYRATVLRAWAHDTKE